MQAKNESVPRPHVEAAWTPCYTQRVALTREQVQHIALLARLELTPDEEAMFAEQLAHILEYIEKLQELDTEGVEPTAHVIDISTPYRQDRVTNEPRTEELLANAPERDGNFFKVPKILE